MVAEKRGYKREDIEQHLGEDVVIYQDVMFLPVRIFSIPRLLLVIKCMGAGGNIVLAEKWNVF